MKLVQAYRATDRYEQSANTAAIVNAKYQSVYRLLLVASLQRFDVAVAINSGDGGGGVVVGGG